MHGFSVFLNYQFNFEKHARRHVKFQFEKRKLDRQKETGRAYRIFSQNVTKVKSKKLRRDQFESGGEKKGIS